MPSVEQRSKRFDKASQSRSAALNDFDLEVIGREMVTGMIIDCTFGKSVIFGVSSSNFFCVHYISCKRVCLSSRRTIYDSSCR